MKHLEWLNLLYQILPQNLPFELNTEITTPYGEASFSLGWLNEIKKTYNAINNIVTHFIELGFVSENKVQKRNKLYRFEPYLKLLEKEYEAIFPKF